MKEKNGRKKRQEKNIYVNLSVDDVKSLKCMGEPLE